MSGSDLVQSLTRGLIILEHLAGAEEGLGLQEIAAVLDVKAPTAHNLLRTLQNRGFVSRRENPVRYVLGPAAVALSEGRQRRGLLRTAGDVLLQVAAKTPGVFTLAQYQAGEVVAVLRATSERPGVLQRPPHQVMSPYSSASSLAFQAFWSLEERSAYRRRYPFAEYGEGTWRSVDQLEDYLAEARRDMRVVLPKQEMLRVAIPIFSAGEEIVAVAGVSAAAVGEAPTRQYIELAQAMAQQIQNQFCKKGEEA